jgi:predicted ArsR family transcriptional regulator
MASPGPTAGEAEIPLERDIFLRRLLRELAGTLQDVVGMQEASGYISVVGAAVGEQIDGTYRRALGVERLSRAQVAEVLVDLKRRIQGDFRVVEETEDRIVLANRACPFGEFVVGRPSLCMMTSNVFGHVTAENLGYAGVEIDRAIALGHPDCRVVVHLRPVEEPGPGTREYFRRDDARPE